MIAATSALGWRVVEQYEGDTTLPEDVSKEGKDLCKLEKEALALQREKKAAQRGAWGAGGSSLGVALDTGPGPVTIPIGSLAIPTSPGGG